VIVNRTDAPAMLPRVGDHVILRGTRVVGDVAHVEGNSDDARISVKVTRVVGKKPTSKMARAWRGAWVTCTPTMVRVFVEDAGLRTDRLPRIFPVDSVEVTEDPAWQFGLRRHLVVATLTTDGEPVRRRAVVAQFILKDANGAVVGGAFTRPDNWAEIIEPDSRVQVRNEFVMATARAESVEVVAYARPE